MHVKECCLNKIKMDKFGDQPNYLLRICDSNIFLHREQFQEVRTRLWSPPARTASSTTFNIKVIIDEKYKEETNVSIHCKHSSGYNG